MFDLKYLNLDINKTLACYYTFNTPTQLIQPHTTALLQLHATELFHLHTKTSIPLHTTELFHLHTKSLIPLHTTELLLPHTNTLLPLHTEFLNVAYVCLRKTIGKQTKYSCVITSFSLNRPAWPIQSYSCDVCLFVCLSMCVFAPSDAVFFRPLIGLEIT